MASSILSHRYNTDRELVWLLRAYTFHRITQTSSYREESSSLNQTGNQTGKKENLKTLYPGLFALAKI